MSGYDSKRPKRIERACTIVTTGGEAVTITEDDLEEIVSAMGARPICFDSKSPVSPPLCGGEPRVRFNIGPSLPKGCRREILWRELTLSELTSMARSIGYDVIPAIPRSKFLNPANFQAVAIVAEGGNHGG